MFQKIAGLCFGRFSDRKTKFLRNVRAENDRLENNISVNKKCFWQ